MSLMTVSRLSADDLIAATYSRWRGREVGVQGQLGHAEDAVHRRADLVAHVRQELGLGPRRGPGLVAGAAEVVLRAASGR